MVNWHSPLSALKPASGLVVARRGAIVLAASFALFLSAGAVLKSGSAYAAAAANPTEAFVQQNIDKGYGILNNKTLSTEQRRAQFRAFMLSLTDMRRVGMFTLGQFANTAPKADIETFITAFTNYAIAVYESRLGKYTGETLKVTGSAQRVPDDIVVNTDVINTADPSAPTYKAAFRVRKATDGRMIVTDIQVEGIWLTLSQRSDFTGFLQQHGGRIPDLITDLNRQTEMMYSGGSPQSASK